MRIDVIRYEPHTLSSSPSKWVLFPTASLILSASKFLHHVIWERTKHKVSTASHRWWQLFGNVKLTSWKYCLHFVLSYMRQNKKANKLWRVRSTNWKSSLKSLWYFKQFEILAFWVWHILKQRLVIKNCISRWEKRNLPNYYVFNLEFVNPSGRKCIYTLFSNSLGQLIVLWPFNIQSWYFSRSIRQRIAYANKENIVSNDYSYYWRSWKTVFPLSHCKVAKQQYKYFSFFFIFR